jgi:hypothetical protein
MISRSGINMNFYLVADELYKENTKAFKSISEET